MATLVVLVSTNHKKQGAQFVVVQRCAVTMQAVNSGALPAVNFRNGQFK
jgi:hypothetical protein